MPELPEVECLTRAVRQTLEGNSVGEVVFFRTNLRTKIPVQAFTRLFRNQMVTKVTRRSKYMLWETSKGTGIFHLGMSGNMLLFDSPEPQLKHTHAVFKVINQQDPNAPTQYLHFIDPRRFGIIDCSERQDLAKHAYFRNLGPEPLTNDALGMHLFAKSRRKSQPIKSFLMDAKNVVGIGNIYASEALFRAKIHPVRKAGSLTKKDFSNLECEIKQTLQEAIASGGTTFRDFRNADSNPGYFAVQLRVYGRSKELCPRCGHKILQKKIAGRSTFFCKSCQH